jgi:hypothetical protein
MRLRRHRRNVVVWRSSARPAGGYVVPQWGRPTRTERIRRCLRIGLLLTVIVVRPRWRPLLTGVALTVIGIVQHDSPVGVVLVPGLLFLWQSVLTAPNPDADRQRHCQLERELAAFSTPAQRRDLEATLDQYPDGLTYEIRDILAHQSVAVHRTQIPGAGRY